VTVARPDIAAGWPEKQPNQRYTQQTVLRETPHLAGSFPDTNPGAAPIENWVFFTSITNEFILELDILCAYEATMDLGRQTLCLAEEAASLWSPDTCIVRESGDGFNWRAPSEWKVAWYNPVRRPICLKDST
jgi:hypothetical protein